MKFWESVRQNAVAIQTRSGCSWEQAWRTASHEAHSGSSSAAASPEIANERKQANRTAASNKNAARSRVIDAAKAYSAKFKVDYTTAWNRTLANPQFANDVAAMNAPLPAIPAMTSGSATQLNMSPQVAALLGIQGSTDKLEIAAAVRANGGNLNPVDYANIFQGLKNYWRAKENLPDDTAAEAKIRALYPALMARVDSLKYLAGAATVS